MTALLSSGGVGVIVSLEDGGVIRETYGRYVEEVEGRKLVPIQFDELYARVLYQGSLINRTPKFLTVMNSDSNEPAEVVMMPLGGMSSRPIVDQWEQEDFAYFLHGVLETTDSRYTYDSLFSPPDKVVTWMNDEKGDLTFWDEAGNRYIVERANQPGDGNSE